MDGQDPNANPGTPPEGTPPAEPLLAGKFKSTDDLVAAYKSLEAKLGSQGKPADPPKDPPATNKVDYAAMASEVASTGKLSDASRQALIASGMPESIIDTYVEAQAGKVTAFKASLHEAVGGADAFDLITTWGAQNLTADEQAYFQGEIEKGEAEAKTAMEVLKARYEKSMGKLPKLLSGATATNDSAGFTSLEEQKAAQRDPRYRTDPAYREQVIARIMASKGY